MTIIMGNHYRRISPNNLVSFSLLPTLLVLLEHPHILSDNNLSGPIPTELGAMSALEELWISNNNKITGTIPIELGELTNLNILYMQDTSLEGTMPTEICLLRDTTTIQSSSGFETQLQNLGVDCQEVECCCCTTCISDTCLW